MFTQERIGSGYNRYGLGDARIADSVSRQAMTSFMSTSRAQLLAAFQNGQVTDPVAADPGWGMFEPARASVEAVPAWVYWTGAGAVVLLVGAVVYKKRKGR
jgi:hypothetical protein